MKEVKQFFIRHFITAPISFGSWLFFVMGAGMNPFCGYWPFGSDLLWRNVYPEADSTFIQLKKTRDVPF